MSDPAKTFERRDVWTDGPEGMRRQVERMRDVLRGLDAGTLPDDGAYTTEDLRGYLASLVAAAELTRAKFPGECEFKGVRWSVPKDRRGMRAAHWREFVVVPTALGAATLSRCVLQFPLLAGTVPGVADVLSAALAYLASRFPAPSPANVGRRVALFEVLHQGWVPLVIWENPRLCLPMNRVLGGAPDFDFEVERALRRRCELFQQLHLQDLRRRRDAKRAWLREWIEKMDFMTPERREALERALELRAAELEAKWLSDPDLVGSQLAPAARAAGDESMPWDAGEFPAPKRMLPELEELLVDQLKPDPGILAADSAGGEGDPAFFLTARLVGRPMRILPRPGAGAAVVEVIHA